MKKIGKLLNEEIYIKSEDVGIVEACTNALYLMNQAMKEEVQKTKRVGLEVDDWDPPLPTWLKFIFGALGWILLGVVLTLVAV